MRGLQAAELLELVADGSGRNWPERADLLLRAALPEADRHARDALSVGARDRHVLKLRALTFGTPAAVRASCPACTEEVEADVDTCEWLRDAPEPAAAELRLTHDGVALVARLPTAGDLRELARDASDRSTRDPDADDAPAAGGAYHGDALVTRCVRTQDAAAPLVIDEALRTSLARAVAAADPLAEIRLEVACPACGHEWVTTLDVVSFFWKELEARAWQVAWSVHRLASRYGWSEGEILAMSPARRGIYLALAGRS